MLCQSCKENPATVHVTEIVQPEEGQEGPAGVVQEQHLCEACSHAHNLPHAPIKKSVAEIWKLLQVSAQRGRRESAVACPECGMTLLEFRQRGRLGCPKDYEVFAPQLRDLLERIHGAAQHVGRVPGLDEVALERMAKRSQLQERLQAAIREEAYEDAARLRDELRSLEQST